MGFRSKSGSSVVAEINVTPLVDVCLVLLIVFMISAPLLQSAIEVDLPKGKIVAEKSSQNTLILTLNAAEKIYLGDQPTTKEAMSQQLTLLLQQTEDLQVIIRADQKLQYGKIMEIMVLLKQIGISKMNLATALTAESG